MWTLWISFWGRSVQLWGISVLFFAGRPGSPSLELSVYVSGVQLFLSRVDPSAWVTIEEFLLHMPFKEKAWSLLRISRGKETIECKGVERDHGDVWSLLRFHVSLWESVSKTFCDYPLGSILARNPFFRGVLWTWFLWPLYYFIFFLDENSCFY